MGEGRQQHTATLLLDGRVLIAGGYWSDGKNWRILSSTEMFDPGDRRLQPDRLDGRRPQTATPPRALDDGRVFIVGGSDPGRDGSVAVASAVLYQP